MSGPHPADRVAIVTGAGQGIGKGIARRLAAEGWRVAIADIDRDQAEQAAAEFRESGSDALAVEANVTEAASVDALIREVTSRWGRLDLLVNNAGIIRARFVTDLTEADWDAVLAVNLKGAFLCGRAAARVMVEQRSGAIVNISSKSGRRGGKWLAAYCASKFGLIGLTQSMAMDLAPFGVRVNAVCPGDVFSSGMWDDLYEAYAAKLEIPVERVREHYTERVPLGRECRIEDVANAVVFLAGDESSYMTGQAINVTGGQVMG